MIKLVLDPKDVSLTPAMLKGYLPCHAYQRKTDSWVQSDVVLTVELHEQIPVIFLDGLSNKSFTAFRASIDRYHMSGWANLAACLGPNPPSAWVEVHSFDFDQNNTLQKQSVRAQKSPFENVWYLEALLRGGRIQLDQAQRQIWHKDLDLSLKLSEEVIRFIDHRRAAERSDILTEISTLLTVSML